MNQSQIARHARDVISRLLINGSSAKLSKWKSWCQKGHFFVSFTCNGGNI